MAVSGGQQQFSRQSAAPSTSISSKKTRATSASTERCTIDSELLAAEMNSARDPALSTMELRVFDKLPSETNQCKHTHAREGLPAGADADLISTHAPQKAVSGASPRLTRTLLGEQHSSPRAPGWTKTLLGLMQFIAAAFAMASPDCATGGGGDTLELRLRPPLTAGSGEGVRWLGTPLLGTGDAILLP